METYTFTDERTALISGIPFRIAHFAQVDSTSDYIKRRLAAGHTDGLPYAAVADVQSAGRGRIGNRAFFSPDGGLYFSVAFPQTMLACGVPRLTIAAGVAAARAIESLCDCRISLKWVNDLLCNGKKAGGILCESVPCGGASSRAYIVGIGVNLSATALGGFMPEKAGALPQDVSRDRLMAAMLENLTAAYTDTSDDCVREYNERLALRGKRVLLRRDAGQEEVTVLGATEEGLVCRTDGGQTHTVRTCDEIVTDLYDAVRRSVRNT